ncbi:ribonuclease H-like domain-containing protein [Tanacetum coccineum]
MIWILMQLMVIDTYFRHEDRVYNLSNNSSNLMKLLMGSVPISDLLKKQDKEVKVGWNKSRSANRNVAFVSSDNSSSTSVSTASSEDQASSASYVDDVMFSFFANQSNAPYLDNEDLKQIDVDDLEEMDLKWQVAMLTIRVKRFIKKTGRKLDLNDKKTIGFDMTKVECYKVTLLENAGHQGTRGIEIEMLQEGMHHFQAEEGPTNFALMAYTSQASSSSDSELEEALKEKDDLKLKLENFEESSKNLTKLINSQISAKDKTGLGYDSQMNESELNNIHINESEVVHIVFNSRESDVDDSLINNRFKTDESAFKSAVRKTTTSVPETETSISKTSKDIIEKPKIVRPSAPVIEEWDTDSDNDIVFRPKSDLTKPKFTKINFVKSGENVKSVNKENTHKQVEYPRKSQSPRGDRRNWNGMMTQKLGNGFESIKKAYFGRVTGQKEVRPVWNNAQRVNHQNKLTHPHPKRNFVPTAVATKSRQVPVNAAKQNSPRASTSISTARPVNIAAPKPKVNDALPTTYFYFQAHSPVKRTIIKRTSVTDINFNKKNNTTKVNNVTTAGPKTVVSAAEGNKENIIDGGVVAFGGSPKGGKITRKGKIRTGKLDFEDVYFVKELKFNLFFVSQMCDKKNSVLFTETECLVLSPNIKLLDESQVLLKVPRQDNMYSFDLKNVVPSGGLTCLFAKATIDESNLWHRRLGHINFKTMNKLVRGNLVRGLPSKLFENDHTCVACQKGKQHKASYTLGKFDGKADEGFLVGYSINSKAFRVFNSRTRKVEENFYITFLENKPNVAGSGPDWLFDIDLLTNSMNYEPVTAWNQTNRNASIKDNVDAIPTQQYILLPLLSDSPRSSEDAVADDAGKKTTEKPTNKGERNGQEKK